MYRYLLSLYVYFLAVPGFCGSRIEYLPDDSITVIRLLSTACALDTVSPMIRFGERFYEIPYVASTLENKGEEHLVVNVREMDCTTFVENIFALARTYAGKKKNFTDFTQNLQLIRYRKGQIDGYPSRLHYFSDWIADNTRKGIVREITSDLQAVRVNKKYDYMSRNSKRYPALRNNPDYIQRIKETEQTLSGQSFYYLPKDSLTESRSKEINNGDIIAITTDIEGLDIVHVGIAYKKGAIIYLLHASQNKGKVILDPLPLTDYLRPHPHQTGIRIIRPILK